VGADLTADAVLERRDDFASGGVVLGVRREDQHHVDGQANGVTLNLDIAFLHDVEKTDLNLTGEVRQFVDSENAAVSARKESVVDGEFIADVLAATGCFDGIDVADHNGYGHVRR